MIEKKYYGNGQIWFEQSYHEGRLHGMARAWYGNGQLQYEFLYHKGQLHGVSRGWYENGQPNYENQRHEGQRHGISKYWWMDHQLPSSNVYYLYGDQVTEEEYRKHELIVKLSGL